MASKTVSEFLADVGYYGLTLAGVARMTTRLPRPSSRRWDTRRISPNGSDRWPAPARSVRASSSPTTTEIAFRGSGCAPRHRFTSESPVQIMAQRQATLDQAHARAPGTLRTTSSTAHPARGGLDVARRSK